MKREKKREREDSIPDWTIETVLKEESKYRQVTKKEILWNKENREIYPVREKVQCDKSEKDSGW